MTKAASTPRTPTPRVVPSAVIVLLSTWVQNAEVLSTVPKFCHSHGLGHPEGSALIWAVVRNALIQM
jgi:hypothetical protein